MSYEEISPIFVLGNPRSGTTLLRLMLTSHSKIHIPPECGFAIWLNEKYVNPCAKGITSNLLQSFLDDLFACRKFDTWNLKREELSTALAGVDKIASYAELVHQVYMAHATKAAKPHAVWGDKNNFYILRVPDVLELFPQAKFIHIVRDPRDIACSYRDVDRLSSNSPYAPRLPTNAEDIASEWSNNLHAVDHDTSNVAEDRFYTVRYEDLVSNPESELRKICPTLCVEFESDMLRFHELNQSLVLEPKLTMDWKLKTLQQVDTESIGRFKQCLSTADRTSIQSISAVHMKRFGYDFE